MKIDSSPQVFHGQVKYSGINLGTVKWKTGSIVLTKEAEGWKLEMKYTCVQSGRPALTVHLSPSTIEKVVCKESGFFLDHKASHNHVTVSYKPSSKHIVRHLQAIIDDIRRPTSVTSIKSEVGINKKPQTTPAKSNPLSSSVNTETSVKKESDNDSYQRFTSVKENKRSEKEQSLFDMDDWEDGKENQIRTPVKSRENYLQKSSEKSHQCLTSIGGKSFYGKSASKPLYNSTPNNLWQNTYKRQPGLMPDPTPIKRARLSDAAIPYSMKTKPSLSSVDSKQQQSLQGFSNLGNTCYMNAILQSLFGLDTFSTDLMTNKKLLKTLSTQSLYYALVKLLHMKRQNPSSSSDLTKRESLRRVKSAISSSAKRFSGYGQHDAHEFLVQVLDQLKEEVIKLSKTTPSPNKENGGGDCVDPQANSINPISVNFEFEVVHNIACLQCHEQVSKVEQFLDISLDLPKRKDAMTPRSLQDALGLFFRNEQIEYTCEKCGHNKSDVTHKITRLPRVFILHLKRYSYSQTFLKNTKVGQNVLVPQYITLQNHCVEQTQPAFPANLRDQTDSNQKSVTNIFEDSKDETPSRRKLDYPSYRFNKKGLTPDAHQTQNGSLFTETKDKKDETDSAQPQALTLEDEEDTDFARAIEMSIKEQEERDQMRRDFGDDSDGSLAQVLELSRRDDREDIREVKEKDFKNLSEEEMFQWAIEQSLRETDTYRHSNYTHSGDVTSPSDHNYGYSFGSDDISKKSYDIGPDKIERRINKKTNDEKNCKTSNQGSVVSDYTVAKNKDTGTQVSDLKQNGDIDTKTDDVTSVGSSTPSQNGSPSNVELISDDTEPDCSFPSSNDDFQCCKIRSTYSARKHWRERLNNLSSKFSSEDESVCSNEEASAIISDLRQSSDSRQNKVPIKCSDHGTMYELHETNNDGRKQSGHSANSMDLNLTMTAKNTNDCPSDSQELDENMNEVKGEEKEKTDVFKNCVESCGVSENSTDDIDSVRCTENQINNSVRLTSDLHAKTENISNVINSTGTQTPILRKCQLTPKSGDTKNSSVLDKGVASSTNGRNTDIGPKGDNLDFDCDEDDSWMISPDDKENKLPDTHYPRLSDPTEFTMDTTETGVDEVDGFIQEYIDLPEINNEKGELPYTYRLVSIVNHMGISSSTGHYLSDVYDMKKKGWYSFDDSHVSKIMESEVRTKRERSGYIFFYMSKDIFDDLSLHHAVSATSKKPD